MSESHNPHNLHDLNMIIRRLFYSAYRAGIEASRAGSPSDSRETNRLASQAYDHVKAYLQPAEQPPADALEALRAVEIALELARSPKTTDDGRPLAPAERIRIMGEEISELHSEIGDMSESHAMTLEGLHSYIESLEGDDRRPAEEET